MDFSFSTFVINIIRTETYRRPNYRRLLWNPVALENIWIAGTLWEQHAECIAWTLQLRYCNFWFTWRMATRNMYGRRIKHFEILFKT
jgi:hypothetical protein